MADPNKIALIALAMLTATALPAPAGGTATSELSAASEQEALYKEGMTSYRKRCARCHGINLVNPGVGVFDLRTFPRDDKTRFVDSVNNGKSAMPAWKAVLGPADIDALWIYITAQQ